MRVRARSMIVRAGVVIGMARCVVESRGGEPTLDRVLAQTERKQLPSPDHTVLAPRELGDSVVCVD